MSGVERAGNAGLVPYYHTSKPLNQLLPFGVVFDVVLLLTTAFLAPNSFCVGVC